MLWLDSDYPVGDNPATPGVARGNCSTSSGIPAQVEAQDTSSYVTYSNLRFGPIGSTYLGSGSSTTTTGSGGSTTSSGTGTSTSSAPGATQTEYGQCAGIGYTGPTVCASGTTCVEQNAYYSQCLA